MKRYLAFGIYGIIVIVILISLLENQKVSGQEKLDKSYTKNFEILSKVHPLIKNFENQDLGLNSIRIMNIGGDYALKIRMCSDGKSILEPKFFVVTEGEYFLALGDKRIKENSCVMVWTYVISDNIDEINLIQFNGNYMPSKYMKIKSIYGL